MNSLGKTLLLANPVAQSGRGLPMAHAAFGKLERALGENSIDLVFSEGPHHATQITAAVSAEYDTIIALGGDGLIHEIANGLMCVGPENRSRLGVIPVGSGNDYARTLGMSSKLDEAIFQILTGREQAADLGCCNGEYFVETLSFGLDAAIALDTVERRKKSGKSGTRLYAASGVDQLLHHLESHVFTAEVERPDGTLRQFSGDSFTFAVQVGCTYGGGFLICPEARIDDGLFDICIAHAPISLPKALLLFGSAKNGGHVGAKNIELFQARSIRITFEQQPPAQIDGEKILATTFEASIIPKVITVIRGK